MWVGGWVWVWVGEWTCVKEEVGACAWGRGSEGREEEGRGVGRARER